MEINNIEGKKVIIASFVKRLLKISFRLTSLFELWISVGDSGWLVMKYSVSSFSADIFALPQLKVTLSFSASLTTSVM